jgi:hypothetical protein
MTAQIRKNVFETNSSSSHSLTMSKGDLTAQPFDKAVLREGRVYLSKHEYGWEWHRYYGTHSKADYLFTQMFESDTIPSGKPESVTRTLREENENFDMLCRVIEEHTGVKVYVEPGTSGYVDHDSHGVGMELFESEKKLHQFLFSPDSFVQTGNDNDSPGKVISTDRGSEHFYQKYYRAPKKSHVVVTLRSVDYWSMRQLATENGAVISEVKQKELFKELLKRGTVVAVDSKEFGTWDYYGGRSNLGDTMSKLAHSGWHFSEDLRVSRKFTQVENRDRSDDHKDETLVHVSMPEALAEQVKALKAPRKRKPAAEKAAA